MNDTGPLALECISLSKTYGSTKALDAVSLTLRAGEVRALLGKNGAGKSTLVNLVSGAQQPDEGTIRVGGEEVHWSGPGDARSGGIAVVHQELSLIPGLSVAENIMLGRWPRAGLGLIDSRALEEAAERAIQILGEPLPLGTEAGRLPLAQQQMVEIAKALVHEPRVLILDEPTSALHSHEVDSLLTLVRRLAGNGVAVIYVSHRMNEIPRVADTLTVLRDGHEVETFGVGEASAERVAALIAGEGQRVATQIEQHDRQHADVVLSVRDLRIPGILDSVSFDLHAGEVLGIAGLLGSGRTELLEAIYGLRAGVDGEVSVRGVRSRRRRPRTMLSQGVGLTPEDRKDAGIVPLLGVSENILLSARGRVLPRFWLRPKAEASIAWDTIRQLSIRAASVNQEIISLSGGNQQKVVIGRLLAAKMSILLLDEPTRGIDVHAKAQTYQLIRDLAEAGVSSIFVSSELDEVSAVCDRVLVLRDGRITDERLGSVATTEMLLTLAMKEQS